MKVELNTRHVCLVLSSRLKKHNCFNEFKHLILKAVYFCHHHHERMRCLQYCTVMFVSSLFCLLMVVNTCIYSFYLQHLLPPYGTPPASYVMYPHGVYAHPPIVPVCFYQWCSLNILFLKYETAFVFGNIGRIFVLDPGPHFSLYDLLLLKSCSSNGN